MQGQDTENREKCQKCNGLCLHVITLSVIFNNVKTSKYAPVGIDTTRQDIGRMSPMQKCWVRNFQAGVGRRDQDRNVRDASDKYCLMWVSKTRVLSPVPQLSLHQVPSIRTKYWVLISKYRVPSNEITNWQEKTTNTLTLTWTTTFIFHSRRCFRFL